MGCAYREGVVYNWVATGQVPATFHNSSFLSCWARHLHAHEVTSKGILNVSDSKQSSWVCRHTYAQASALKVAGAVRCQHVTAA